MWESVPHFKNVFNHFAAHKTEGIGNYNNEKEKFAGICMLVIKIFTIHASPANFTL